MAKRPSPGGTRTDLREDAAKSILAPSLARTLFWEPDFLVDSRILVHVPLLFWLVGVLHPRRIAVLGCNDGMAHFAFCQALERLGIDGRSLGFGFWGEATSGGDACLPPADLTRHQNQHHDGRSQLLACSSVGEAVDQIGPGQADLLFVDLTVLPDSGEPERARWLRCLSRPGVLVMHGVGAEAVAGAVVAETARSLDADGVIEFPGGAGVVVVAAGEDLPEALKTLLAQAANGKPGRHVEAVFTRVGQGLMAKLQAGAGGFVRPGDEARPAANPDRLRHVQSAPETRPSSLVAEGGRPVRDPSDAGGSQPEVGGPRRAMADDKARMSGVEPSLERTALEAERRARFEETATLTHIAETLRADLAKASADLALRSQEKDEVVAERTALLQERAEFLQRLSALMEERASLLQWREAVLSSTSWRITGPIRAVKNVIFTLRRGEQ
jgi:hypothetical protein